MLNDRWQQFKTTELTTENLKRRFRAQLSRDVLGRLILAFLFASIVWYYVVKNEDPFLSVSYDNVAVMPEILSPNLIIISTIPAVKVTINAPQGDLNSMSATSHITASIDLNGVSSGNHSVNVHVNVPESLQRYVTIDPPILEIQLDTKVTKTLTLHIVKTGDVPTGYEQHGTPNVQPSQVTISGPANLVNSATEAQVRVDLTNRKSSLVDIPVKVIILNELGVELNSKDFSVKPDTVNVFVPIDLKIGFVEVPIHPVTKGMPAAGYAVGSYNVNPLSVTLSGDPQALAQIHLVDTQAVDISGATNTVTRTVSLVQPPNVTVYEGNSSSLDVEVTVQIIPQEGSRAINVAPTISGLGAGLQVTIDPSTVQLFISGPEPVLSKLRLEDIKISLDVQNLPPGIYSIVPDVTVPDQLRVTRPDTVKVTITAKPTLTPTLLPVTATPISLPGTPFLPPGTPTTIKETPSVTH